MNKVKRFFLYWIHSGVLIYLANQIFPEKFVLGNFRFTVFISVLVTSLLLTLFLEVISIYLKRFKKVKLDRKKRFLVFWVLNFSGLWLITRYSAFAGFGVVKFTWLIGLSFLTNTLQALLSKK